MYPISSILISVKRGKVIKIIVEDLKEACLEEISQQPTILKLDLDTDDDDEKNDQQTKISKNQIYCSRKFCEDDEEVRNGFCDFKLFLSWIGSDKNHRKLISSSERFMIFKHYNLKDLFGEILKITNISEKKDYIASTNDYIPFRGQTVLNEITDEKIKERLTTIHSFEEKREIREI